MANEVRLIDANALIEKLQEAVTHKGMGAMIAGVLIRYIEKLPTVDAVEVVRCKDCKYAMDMMPIENSGGCLMGECTLRKEDDIVFTAWGDEFCSYGERKDNG